MAWDNLQMRPSIHFWYLLLAVSDKNMALAGGLIILVSAELVAAIIYYARLETAQSFVQSETAIFYSHSVLACSALAVCVDTAIVLSIVVLLFRYRSEVLSRRTSSMVNRIMIYTVGSGLLTAASALAGLVTTLTMTSVAASSLTLQMLPKREISPTNGVHLSTNDDRFCSLFK